MKIVLDTNIMVSALINSNGIPGKIMALVLNGKIRILYDNRIIFEYIDVLSRKNFGFNDEIIYDVINYFRNDGEYINSGYSNSKFIDDTDKKFYEVFKSGEAEYLVTENIKRFPKEKKIIIPGEFIEKYK
ncbi:MAG: putative toxin-antitoxin system toxin component, PIN family [Treponema sp.]|jgi:putative PIN family toxin of toxin-antitoxin system|nr:putative toxin-antitoxin system toxin component, PIN family [Treponema sp.]